MDLGLSLKVLGEPTAPRLNHRFAGLGLMPSASGPESSIPTSLKLCGNVAVHHDMTFPR
jgi:hypothetical protein